MSTRSRSYNIISLMLDGVISPALDLHDDTTIAGGYHALSHHGRSENEDCAAQGV